MKKLLVLGGIALSKQIIDEAHKNGIEAYVTDYLENSPAKRFADKSFMVSTTDADAVAELVMKEKVDGVLTGYIDLLLPYYVEICHKTNLPCYATKEQIAITTDKAKFKALCNEFGVPTVSEYTLEDVNNNKCIYPLLIKPVDNSGARGIYVCKNYDEFQENYVKSLEFSPSKQILIERYIDSPEATIFYYIHNGEIYLLGVGDRHMKRFDAEKIPLPIGYTFPSVKIDSYIRNVDSKVKQMFKSLGMKEGMVFVQSFVCESGFIIYEMGYRLTGSIEQHLFEKVYSFNQLKEMINYAVGNAVDTDSIKRINPIVGSYANVTLLLRQGTISEYQGLEAVKAMPEVLEVFVSYGVGTEITSKQMGTLAQVGVRVLLTADNKIELLGKMDKIKEMIKILDQNGGNMVIDNYSYLDIEH